MSCAQPSEIVAGIGQSCQRCPFTSLYNDSDGANMQATPAEWHHLRLQHAYLQQLVQWVGQQGEQLLLKDRVDCSDLPPKVQNREGQRERGRRLHRGHSKHFWEPPPWLLKLASQAPAKQTHHRERTSQHRVAEVQVEPLRWKAVRR
eukprot:963322-Amphidinium_carterae.1